MVKTGAYVVAHLSAYEFLVHAVLVYLQRTLALKANAKMRACKTGVV